MLTVNATQAADLMAHCIEVNSNLMLWGATGIGKTEVCKQVAERLKYQYFPWMLLLHDAVDMRGAPMPNLADRITEWLPPADLPFKGSKRFAPDAKIFLHIDEINAAAPSLMAVGMQLVHERRAGEHELLDGVRIVACGNRQGVDRGVANKMPATLENRFRHALMVPDVDAWARRAKVDGIKAVLIAFLTGFKRDLLHYSLVSAKYDFAEPTHLSPRAWYDVNKSLDLLPPLRQIAVASIVGEGPAADLESFIGIFTALPPIQSIVANPSKAPLPDDVARTRQEAMGLRYAIAVALGRIATRANLPDVITYCERLPRETMIVAMRDAITRDPKLMDTAAFGKWAIANQDVTL